MHPLVKNRFHFSAIFVQSFLMPRKDTEQPADQRELAKVAKEASSWRVRRAAVERLTDQALLADVVKHASGWSIRRAAAAKLDPKLFQALFAELAQSDEHLIVRLTVVERLTDQALLADVAKYAKDPTIRDAARKRLVDLGARND